MKNRMTAALLAATTSLALAAPVATVNAAERAPGERSLIKVLRSDGNKYDRNWGDFDLAERAVTTVLRAKPSSPVAALKDGSVALTAFLPTDRAFRILVADLFGKHPRTEKRVLAILKNKFDLNTIEAVLEYHVVPGATITYKQALAANGVQLTTATPGGDKLTVKVRKGRVTLKDLDPSDANGRVIKSSKNINKGNKQIAHGVNHVLRLLDL